MQESDNGGAHMFPDLDHLLALVVLDPKSFVDYITDTRWLSKEDFKAFYFSKLDNIAHYSKPQ